VLFRSKSLTGKEQYYELSRDLSDRLGEMKRSGFLKSKEYSAPIQEIRDILEILDKSIEIGRASCREKWIDVEGRRIRRKEVRNVNSFFIDIRLRFV